MLPKILVVLLIIVGAGFAFRQFGINDPQEIGRFSQENNNGIEVFYEEIPGSKFHGPDATWWGYNQTKIVRFGNIVFTYVIENTDGSNKTTSPFVIYKKEGSQPWKKGASFTTSRPGNIIIDSQGVLHAFVFEPFDVIKNDSWGKLKHYWFPNAKDGDIANYEEETVIDNDGTNETVNIRIGVAIGKDDTMAIGFGLTTYNPLYKGYSEHLYFKKPAYSKWTHLIAGENLGHDWYYPFVWVDKDEFYLLPVQDDFNGSGTPTTPYPNIYQKIMYFTYQQGKWEKELLTDLSQHPLASSRPRLLEQEELFKDSQGRIHILYKEFLDPSSTWKTTNHKHIIRQACCSAIKESSSSTEQTIDFDVKDINWIRLFEVENTLYYFMTTFDGFFIAKVGEEKIVKLPLPKGPQGTYPYIATARTGTRANEQFVDILLLAADQKLYSEGKQKNYYLRIPNLWFPNILQSK